MDRRKDAHAAAEGLPDPGEVGGTCDLVHGQPLRVHPAQQHLHACGLRAAGEHVRVRAEVELRHAMHRARQLQPLVHNADAAARLGWKITLLCAMVFCLLIWKCYPVPCRRKKAQP